MRTFVILFSLLFIMMSSSCARRVVTTNTANATVIRVAPRNHKVVVIKGKRYYLWNGRYHRKTRNGYVVVKVR